MPKIRKWRDKLLSRDTVRNAIGEENAGQVTQSLAARNSVAGRLAKEVLASRDRTVA
jgi:hypothetical protein